MRGIAISAGLLCGVLFSAAAGAASSSDWTGKGTFGGVLARGNTDTETVNAVLDVQTVSAPWTHKLGASILRTVTDDITSADRWELRGETNYDLTERGYLFGTARYEDDQFTDYAYQATAAIGCGYHFVATGTTTLDGRFGIGARRAELRQTNNMEADAILRLAVEYKQQLTGNTSLYDRLLVEAGEINTFTQNALGLEVKMTQTLSVALSYELRYNSDVLPGTLHADQVFTAGLAAAF